METELSFAKQPFCYGSHHFWVMSYGNRELSYQKRQSKSLFGQQKMVTQFPSLNFHHSSLITQIFIIHFLSLNIFHTIHGPHNCYCVRPLLFCYPRTIFPISISLFLISPSLSALSLSQSRNPNLEKCLNLPRLVSTIIIGEQRPSLWRV